MGVSPLVEQQLCGFVSYSHKDIKMKQKFLSHFSPLKKKYNINIWHDGCIQAGQQVDKAVMSYLSRADIVFLLVTSEYVSSSNCYEVELEKAIKRHNEKKCIVIPVILRPVGCVRDLAFGELLMVPTDGKPVTKFSPRDDGYVDAIQKIDEVIKNWINEAAQAESSTEKSITEPVVGKEDIEDPISITPSVTLTNSQNTAATGLIIYQDGEMQPYPISQSMIDNYPALCEKVSNFSTRAHQFNDEQYRQYKKDYRKDFKVPSHCTPEWWRERVSHYLLNFVICISNELFNMPGVRIHLRKKENANYTHVVAVEKIGTKVELSNKITSMPSVNSMISAANRFDAPLIKSLNLAYHHNGTHDDKWIDYFTCVFKKLDTGLQPILALGISIDSENYCAKRDMLILFAHARIDNIIQCSLLDYCSKCKQIDSSFDLKHILSLL